MKVEQKEQFKHYELQHKAMILLPSVFLSCIPCVKERRQLFAECITVDTEFQHLNDTGKLVFIWSPDILP